MENRNRVVMGYPSAYYQAHQPYQYHNDPNIITPIPIPNENKQPLRVRCAKCILLILAPIFIVLFLLFAIYLFFILQLRSPKIQIDMIWISPYHVSNDKITTHWNLSFVPQNNNKYCSIHFKKVSLGLFDFGEKRLASTNIDDFSLGIGGETLLKPNITALSVKVKDKSTMVVAFKMKMDAVVWLETRVWNAEQWQLMEADCGVVVVKFLPDEMTRGMIPGSKWCKVIVK